MATLLQEVTGRTLAGRYEVLDLDHEELLGAVYRARDDDSGELVSVKVLHPHLTEDTEKFKRFGREITATYMVAQQNTIEVTDWGQDGELYYLVTEFVRGQRLEAVLQAPLPIDRVTRIAVQIARAIGAAHQEGIVHRALGPSNILLLDNAIDGDFVKVLDFGLSKLEKVEDEETGLTTQNTRVGNAEYMAPEYIQSGQFHTKGDLYALGALMFHMLTGKPPFTGTMMDVLSAHVGTEPVAPSTQRAETPSWMDELVLELLGKTPEKRPGAYRVVQTLEMQAGDLKPPALYDLDENGAIVIPEGPPVVAIALGISLLVLLVVALTLVFTLVAGVLVFMVMAT